MTKDTALTGEMYVSFDNGEQSFGPYYVPAVQIYITYNKVKQWARMDGLSLAVTNPFFTPWGENSLTVSLVTSNAGRFMGDQLLLPVRLRLESSLDLPNIDETSEVPLYLGTTPPLGRPISAEGRARLGGVGICDGGLLSGSHCKIIVTGGLSPIP